MPERVRPKNKHSATEERGRKRRPWRWLVLAAVLLVPVAAAFVLIDRDPLVLEVEELTTERATRARGLVERIRMDFILATEQPREFVMTEDELNGVAALAKRAVPQVSGRANITPMAMLGALTLQIPSTPFGSYVNVLVELAPSSGGIELSKVRVGSLPVPSFIAMPVARLALDALLGWGNGRAMLAMIGGVVPAADRVTVTFNPDPQFAARMAEIRLRLRQTREGAIRVSDAERVVVYYQYLVELDSFTGRGEHISLARFISPVFELAGQRSRTSSAIEENRAAIMALAIHFGTPQFQLFTGPVVPEGTPERGRPGSRATLADRVDLRLHFIYSAALKLAADSGVSFALGEFKEMLDSGAGGSGFSFADLAADRAGIRFAEAATAGEAGAFHLQAQLAAGDDENLFFPSLVGLQEGIGEADFQRDYAGLDSAAYRAMVEEIDRRIAALPLYR